MTTNVRGAGGPPSPAPLTLADAPDFPDLVREAAVLHGILPALVLKDYWVTRVLRAIATDPAQRGRVLFKGGTSLSKGWRIIDRFSEDIDLLLTGPSFGPAPATKGDRERHFKAIKARVEDQTPLRLPEQSSISAEDWRFLYLRSDFHCNVRYPLPDRTARRSGSSQEWLLLEMGYRGGANPHAQRPITSLAAEVLETRRDAAAAFASYASDLEPFPMDLLKPERTFAEKLLLLHGNMNEGIEGARRVATRHYYDIVRLAERSEEVQASLERGEVQELLRDAARVSNEFFGTAFDAEELDLARSPALSPSPEQQRVLRASFEQERELYYRDPLSFDEILQRLGPLQDALAHRRAV